MIHFIFCVTIGDLLCNRQISAEVATIVTNIYKTELHGGGGIVIYTASDDLAYTCTCTFTPATRTKQECPHSEEVLLDTDESGPPTIHHNRVDALEYVPTCGIQVFRAEREMR